MQRYVLKWLTISQCCVTRDGQGRTALHWGVNFNLVDLVECILHMHETSSGNDEPSEEEPKDASNVHKIDPDGEKASLLELQVRIH